MYGGFQHLNVYLIVVSILFINRWCITLQHSYVDWWYKCFVYCVLYCYDSKFSTLCSFLQSHTTLLHSKSSYLQLVSSEYVVRLLR